jgi:hypothetical protein
MSRSATTAKPQKKEKTTQQTHLTEGTVETLHCKPYSANFTLNYLSTGLRDSSLQPYATADVLATVHKSSLVAVLGQGEEIWYAIVKAPPKKKTSSAYLTVNWLKVARTNSTGAIILQDSDESSSTIELGAVLDVVRHTAAVGGSYLVDKSEQKRLSGIRMAKQNIITVLIEVQRTGWKVKQTIEKAKRVQKRK